MAGVTHARFTSPKPMVINQFLASLYRYSYYTTWCRLTFPEHIKTIRDSSHQFWSFKNKTKSGIALGHCSSDELDISQFMYILHYTLLHYPSLHCTAHCTALHCTALYCTARHCTALHCTALHCTALHFTALHCTALHTALHCTCTLSVGWHDKLTQHCRAAKHLAGCDRSDLYGLAEMESSAICSEFLKRKISRPKKRSGAEI